MSLIRLQDIKTGLGLNKFGFLATPFAWVVKKALSLDGINAIYDVVRDKSTDACLASILRQREIKHELHEEDIKRIPTTGPFILVANHPLGGLDGILMMKVIREIRPDFHIIGNFLLHKIDPLKPIIYPVNPFENRKDVQNSLNGMRNAYKHIKNGGCLGVFPAGEVSTKDATGNIQDREWQESILKFIQKANVPIVPLYFHTRNSQWFYRLAKVHPDLQTAMLPRELLRKRVRPIRMRLGKPISPTALREHESVEDLGAFLRKKTYALAAYYKQKKGLGDIKLNNPIGSHRRPKAIAAETPRRFLELEIERLKQEDALLFANHNYECYFANAKQIPKILNELGRLRELTFREIGEGTNKSLDLDKYDEHYHHLFLWDTEGKSLVGAYRMALGQEVFEKYGLEGFYLSELFNIEPELQPFFRKCIEMGRAFVVPEYQQKPFPLFLLWRGIVHITLRNPNHKYIIGGVSISNQFSDFSKSLMIEFMRSHYYDPFVAQYVRPKKEFKIKVKDDAKEFFFDEAKADLNKFDKLIDELEPNMLRLPVLIKKYIKQNARVIGFNVDPKFNDAIDGLMYIRISDIPEETVKPVIEELQKAYEAKRTKK